MRGKVEVVQLFNALLALRPFAARALTRQTSAGSLRSAGSSAGGSPATFDEILDMRNPNHAAEKFFFEEPDVEALQNILVFR
mgnify:CR=1 FL=1